MTSELEEGLLNVFLSSTYEELKEVRDKLITRFDKGLVTICMEQFRPRGIPSQEISIEDPQKSNLAIFVISQAYGTKIKGGCQLLKKCAFKECSMRRKDDTKVISYTHCEYRYNTTRKIPHWTYMIKAKSDDKKDDDAIEFKEEIKKLDCYSELDLDKQFTDEVADHLVNNILDLYRKKKLNLNKFCGRREKLQKLVNRIYNGGTIEVIGVGGIGKTTFCDVALLISRLLNKGIYYLAGQEGHSSETGYKYRKLKIEATYNDKVTLDSIAEAMNLKIIDNIDGKKNQIMQKLNQDNGSILYIDNYQEDEDVRDLIKRANNQLQHGTILISAKKEMRLSSNRLQLGGIKDGIELVEIFAEDLNKKLTKKEIKKIAQVSEGHPIATYLLVSNVERIDFSNLENFKEGLDFSDDRDVQEYIDRVIEGILSKEARRVLKDLALIDEELDRKSIYEAIPKTYPKLNANEIFGEILNAFILQRKGDKIKWAFNQIRKAIFEDINDRHNLAVQYYKRKEENYNDLFVDTIEKLYHLTKKGFSEGIYDIFFEIYKVIKLEENLEIKEANLLRFCKWGEIIDINNEINKGMLNELGSIYLYLSRFRNKKNRLLKALEYHLKALDITVGNENPVLYSSVQNSIGVIYQNLAIVENKRSNSLKAIKAFQEALKVKLEEKLPNNYTRALSNLGNTYITLSSIENSVENCKKAITMYKDALSLANVNTDPQFYARILGNLGNAYSQLADVENTAENSKEAIKVIEKSLEIISSKNSPRDYARGQSNLGASYRALADVENTAENCKKAIIALDRALSVISFEVFPYEYVMINNNMGNAYRVLAEIEHTKKNCEIAISLYKKTLRFVTIKTLPNSYAETQNNLGNAYLVLAQNVETKNNCKNAINAYNKALKIRTIEKMPVEHAITITNLGNAYKILAEVENKEEYCIKAKEKYLVAERIFLDNNIPVYLEKIKISLEKLENLCSDK